MEPRPKSGIWTVELALSRLAPTLPCARFGSPVFPVMSTTLEIRPPYCAGKAPLYTCTSLIASALKALKKPKK